MKIAELKFHKSIKILAILVSLFAVLYILHLYTLRFIPKDATTSLILLWLAVILLFAKLSGAVERYGHPSVLGELIVGAIFGNVALIGITFLEPAKTNQTMQFLMQLGSVLLLFQAGLAIDLLNVRKFLGKATLLAVLGLVFSIGCFNFVLPLLLPGESQLTYIYLALALSPTGASVTTRVLQDLGKLRLKKSQYIISAGAIDNIVCFTIQAVLIAYQQTNTVSVGSTGMLTVKILSLIAGILVFCTYLLPVTLRFFAAIYPHRSLKFAFAFSVGLFSAFFAQSIGISPVIGAFLAGVAISPHYFSFFSLPAPLLSIEQSLLQDKTLPSRKMNAHLEKVEKARLRDLEEMFVTPSFLLVSIFFVVTGMSIDVRVLTNPQYVFAAITITLLFFITKTAAAVIVERKIKSITGVGMSPRGATTLVFAAIGTKIGILPPEHSTIIIFTVMLATFITPLLLTALFRRLEVE